MKKIGNINNEWFSKKRLISLGLGAILTVTLTACSSTPTPTPTAPVETPTVSEQVVETPAPTVVDGDVEYITIEEAKKTLENIYGVVENDWELKNIDKRSINSLYFRTNYRYFSKQTIADFISQQLISDNSNTVYLDAFEIINAINNNCTLYYGGENGALFNISIFCENEEDITIAQIVFDSLCAIEATENRESEFDNYFNWAKRVESKSDYEIARSSCSEGVQSLICDSYTGAFIMAAPQSRAYECDVLATYVDDHSAVKAQMQSCMSGETAIAAEDTVTPQPEESEKVLVIKK